MEKRYFEDFGSIPLKEGYETRSRVADMDGDGYLDIIVTKPYSIRVIENRIPQKNQE